MLQLIETEQDAIIQRGLQASTFIAQPFWAEMQKAMHEAIEQRLQAMRGAKDQSADVKANLLDRWLLTEELVARIERIPAAAIEDARELGENNG